MKALNSILTNIQSALGARTGTGLDVLPLRRKH